MKNIFIILLFLGSLSVIAQPQVGMSTSYSISPSAATTQSVGIAYGNTVSITCYIKNKGLNSFTGLITIYKRVDTLANTGIVAVYDSIAVNNFAPNDSLQIVITETVTPGNYRQAGNGNTIVVWPYISGATPADSLTTNPVYVHGTTGIEEQSINTLVIFPNPTSDRLLIKTETGITYDKIRIYDMQAKQVMEIKFKEDVDIRNLPAGTYWISISTRNNKWYGARFVKNE